MSMRLLRFKGSAVQIDAVGEHALRLAQFTLPQLVCDSAEAVDPIPCLHIFAQENETYCLEEDGAAPVVGSFGAAAVTLMGRATYHLADQSSAGAVFHGALVERQGKGLALLGASGAGKSTLAAWLAGKGFTCLTDELVFAAGDDFKASGLARPVFLKGNTAALFPDLAQRGAVPVEGSPNRAAGWLAPLYPKETDAVKLHGVVFPQYQAGAKTQVEALSRPGAAVALAGLLVNARNLPENGFPAVLRLARTVPAWKIVYSKLDENVKYFMESLI